MKMHEIYNKKYSNYAELESVIENLETKKSEGNAFEDFAYFYFLYHKDLYQIKEIYNGSNIPDEYKIKYKFEKRDSGVDGLIIKEDGNSIAYQVKFRKDHAAPSYDDLTSFWAESEHTDERCIFANCYSLPQQTYKKKNQFLVLRDNFSNLDEHFFDSLYNFAINSKSPIMKEKFRPKDHQKKMIEEVLKGFETYDRGKLLAACGTGKTLTSLWIKEEMKAKKVLFVAPNLALIKQTLDSWIPQASDKFNYLCVCSDMTVANRQDAEDYDENSELSGVPVTTDNKRVSDFLSYQSTNGKVIFSTYQSLDVVVMALQSNPDFIFDIAFFDEAHRTAGNKNSEMFVLGMSDAFIPCKKRLFMTATERFVNPHILGRAKKFNYDVFSMDNEEQYGITFTTLSFRDAIEQGIISDYKIVLCCMKEGELRKIVQDNQIINLGDHKVDAQTLFKQVLLAKTMDDIGVKKVISYHRNIESAKGFIVPQNGAPLSDVISNINEDIESVDVFSSHVNGTMSAGERKEIFDVFIATPYGIISNARCLTEGVDVPIIDAVYFAEPKNSIIDIIQAVGRSLRIDKSNPNKVSYIIIPVVISEAVAKFSDIDPKEFSTLHSVIQALRDQDRILADFIDKLNLRVAKGKTKQHLEPDCPIIVELSEEMEIEDFSESLSLRIAEVNKDSSQIAQEFKLLSADRTSGVKRTFRTVGDYTIEAYNSEVVVPTLKKYENPAIGLPRESITFNHNNVSHSVKIGAIYEKDLKFFVSDVGRAFIEYPDRYREIFKSQMLKYYELDAVTRIPRFPYRLALKTIGELGYITKLEFAYSLYIIKSMGEKAMQEAIERVNYIRQTYPNIEVLNEVNKRIVLDVLNSKYETTLTFEDIWTSRTTVYNQFNYIKKHLLLWDDIFDSSSSKDVIKVKENSNAVLSEVLEKTAFIETCPTDSLKKLFLQYN